MTQRERRLAYVILGFIVLAGAGFFGYQFYLVPLRAGARQILALDDEVLEAQGKVKKILADKKRLTPYFQVSLPHTPNTLPTADLNRRMNVAQGEYIAKLNDLLRESGFETGSIVSISAKPPDNKSPLVPKFGKESRSVPVYTRLDFDVVAKGDLATLVDWMERFYKLRLLHQIRNLTVTRPMNPDRARPNDLEVKVVIEALVLDNAPQRKTLEPEKPVELPPVLAPDREYARIAGKDPFFGAPPRERPEPERTIVFNDASPHTKLDGRYKDDEGEVATLYDAFHNHDYTIRPRAAGDGFRVQVSYYLNGKKRDLRTGKEVQLSDEDGETRKTWTVVKFLPDGVIWLYKDYFQSGPARHVAQRLGQTLADAAPLSKEELSRYGLKAGQAAADETARDKEERVNGDKERD